MPHLMLWAWEMPEDLRFLKSPDVGVAFLAGSLYLAEAPHLLPRLQPLRVGREIPLTAVVRIEITPQKPAVITAQYRSLAAESVASVANHRQISALQIDFDATLSQREFYRALIKDVRDRLPSRVGFSITALGSWCLGDDWLAGLPIDEAVPMIFRMGRDGPEILRALATGGDLAEPLCRHSVGVATDEPWPEHLYGRQVFLFAPQAWVEKEVASLQRRLKP
jgi:hypothetical protein